MTKTIKDQTVEQLGGTGSILVRQRREHQEMDRLMDQYLTLDDLHQRERVLKQVVQLVFSHAFAEETVLWPAVRASVRDGEELTARVEAEHQQINDLVADIECRTSGTRKISCSPGCSTAVADARSGRCRVRLMAVASADSAG
ncbi:hemerythrin domain-containing protein [Streptomyces sp. NBC_00582]|uniref:hemerythrin domain-containing protein n=1 Tax=Streptomyces sp. NBC_00582 TaxID=2975783 RepID=UPI002E81AE63|nr:hemerythrin domain-containing protein [Streptomyces sp. NBC_00582]WUB67249.1 hemerythrin domain-containing protein [Streptomyces sp. NBC_00582]